MKRSLALTLVAGTLLLAATSPAPAQDNADLPLPRWSPEELDTMRGVPDAQAVPESMLWPPGMMDITPPMTLPWYLGEADSPDADQPHADVSLFLPPALAGATKPAIPPPIPPLAPTRPRKVVTAEFMSRLAASPASIHLIDPSAALPAALHEDLTRFVESHARDARIKLYVLVLDAGEHLPVNANLADVAQGAMNQDHGCLLVYPLGDPGHARLFMSRSVCKVASPTELNELLQDARQDAFEAATRDEQLHRMLVRLSIRLFWLERLLDKAEETIAKALPVPAPLAVSATSSLPLPEVVDNGIRVSDEGRSFPWQASGGALLALLAGFVLWRWQNYRLRHFEWVLPAPAPIQPRFGAPHCASAVWTSYH